ncbi:hypothetical protein AYI70_g2489, partial [Smittium culicis]
MKFSIFGLVLISSIASILATPVAQDDQADAGSIQKRGYGGGHRGGHR